MTLPIELRDVQRVVSEGGGFWRACSGCYETNEGAPPNGAVFSQVFGCYLGHGCSECGGIGAIWDSADYESLALDEAAEAALVEGWAGQSAIESPFNACQHKAYCCQLKREHNAPSPNALKKVAAILHVKKLKFGDVHINNHEWIEWKIPKYDGMKLFVLQTSSGEVSHE